MLRTLFSFDGELDRRTYVLVALACVAIKHAIDIALAYGIFHREFTFLNYLVPLGLPLQWLTQGDRVFLLSLVAVSLPFAWVGMAITVKRFRSLGWPPLTALLFFVPVANIVSFLVAAVMPDRSQALTMTPFIERHIPRDKFAAAFVSVVLTAILGTLLVALGTRILVTYGWGLFAAIPFAQGAIAALLYGAHERRTLAQCMSVALASHVLSLLCLLAVALEGVICIAMAAPLALGLASLGAAFGYVLQNRSTPHGSVAALFVLIVTAPAIMGAESALPRETPTYVVRSELVIDAPPQIVWKNVVAFPDLPAPQEAIFRLGIAYPERARIVGRGVGAIRYCEFSTGDFVEPITAWVPGKRLAFRVAHNAEPMRELSIYRGLDTAHLHGYMLSKHGEFDLLPLPGGRTRLIGITWYQHHLWPAPYWAVYSDAIVHEIHMRVLRHIKRLSEGGGSSDQSGGNPAKDALNGGKVKVAVH